MAACGEACHKPIASETKLYSELVFTMLPLFMLLSVVLAALDQLRGDDLLFFAFLMLSPKGLLGQVPFVAP